MIQELINKAVQPLLESEYKRGYSAGVSAEKLVKEKEWADREYDLLCRGAELERQRILKEMDDTIEEISAKEFAELAELDKEPFGFVGTMDDMSLVLDDVDTALEEVSA